MANTDPLPGRSITVNREFGLAAMWERTRDDRWTLTYWFERWVGTGTYWLCGPWVIL